MAVVTHFWASSAVIVPLLIPRSTLTSNTPDEDFPTYSKTLFASVSQIAEVSTANPTVTFGRLAPPGHSHVAFSSPLVIDSCRKMVSSRGASA